MSEISEHFYKAFQYGGTTSALCEGCGKVHFCTHDEGCYEPGELEVLRIRQEEDPGKYIEHDYSSLDMYWVNGKQCVVGCSCLYGANVEAWIWQNRKEVIDYYKSRMAENKAVADAELETLGGIDSED